MGEIRPAALPLQYGFLGPFDPRTWAREDHQSDGAGVASLTKAWSPNGVPTEVEKNNLFAAVHAELNV